MRKGKTIKYLEHELNGTVCLVGDIHGEYLSGKYGPFPKLADNYVFLGDIGFGFHGLVGFCHRLDRRIPSGVNVYFLRGNHDNPAFWRGYRKKRISELFPRFHMVHDYDVLLIDGKKYLCIGGGISIDRFYRIEGESYWSDEAILPCPKKNILGEIDGIFSHTGFVPPVLTHKHFFQDKFPDVDKDCQDEQRILYEILELYKPKKWFCGHYHVSCDFFVKECECHILDCEEHFVLGGGDVVKT